MKDSRVEYARAVAARAKLEIALDLARQARSETATTVGHEHTATRAIDDVVTAAQIAVGRLNIAIPRIH